MAFYGYARVSTEKQAAEGVSLDMQEKKLAAIATQHDGDLVRIFREEGVSGSVPLADRPQGAAMLETVRAGDTIIAMRLDRLFRSALDTLRSLEALKERGVRIIFGDIGDTDSANGRMMLTILAAVSEAERDILRERLKAVKLNERAKGRHLGGTLPFGYEKDEETGLLSLTDWGAEARKEMRRLRAEGQGFRKIATALQAKGWEISHMGVKKVLDAEDAAPEKRAA